jgi:hypothetical protein
MTLLPDHLCQIIAVAALLAVAVLVAWWMEDRI